MNRKNIIFVLGIAFFSFAPAVIAAATIVVTEGDISFSKPEPLIGDKIRIYATIANRGDDDARGIVKFFDGSKQIGTDQPFSILRGKTSDVFTDYENLPYGDRKIALKVSPWPAQTTAISATVNLFVDRDSDKDEIPDRKDPDDDNDTVEDTRDAFPLDPTESVDTDKDGAGDNKDADDDADGVNDEEEKKLGTDSKVADTDGDEVSDKLDTFPLDKAESLDTDGDKVGNNADPDDDNDGVSDDTDELPLDLTESKDNDKDGIGDQRDVDDDNDNLPDGREKDVGTDPRNPDTDGDGSKDKDDFFPLDDKEWLDSDTDGLGDNADPNNNNKGPILNIKVPDDVTLLLPYFFDASGTTDPDGTIEKIVWQVDGQIREQPSFWYMFFSPGRQIITVAAIDDAGESRTKTFEVKISGILYVFLGLVAALIWTIRKVLNRPKGFKKEKIRNP